MQYAAMQLHQCNVPFGNLDQLGGIYSNVRNIMYSMGEEEDTRRGKLYNWIWILAFVYKKDEYFIPIFQF